MATALRFLWALPNTLVGLVIGALTLQRPRLAAGVLVFDRASRGTSALLARTGRSAMTIGFVIIANRPVTGRLLRHELHHVRQYERLGPLFLPAYLLLWVLYGYDRHPLEVAAVRAEASPPTDAPPPGPAAPPPGPAGEQQATSSPR